MMGPLKLGIIGTGVAARELHWPALAQMKDRFQIVAVANRSRDKAEAFAKLLDLNRPAVYSDYREMLLRENLDVVDLALPPQLNYEAARAAAEAGIHVICEKPIGVTLEDGRALAALPEEFGVKVLIAENFRYDKAVQKARNLIDAGVIAPPFMMSYQYVQPVPPDDEIASRPWRQQPAHAGGFLSDHGVHMIDVTRFLMGEVARVQTFARDLRGYLAGLDTAVYSLEFRSGALGSIQWSFAVASEPSWLIQLWSEDATLQVGRGEVRAQRQGQPDEVYPISGPTSFVNEFQDFYEALVTGKRPLMTLQDGLWDLEVILAAHHSALTNQVVVLDQG